MTERNSVDALKMELPKWLDLISTSGWRTSRNEVITEFSLSKKILRILKNRILMCKRFLFLQIFIISVILIYTLHTLIILMYILHTLIILICILNTLIILIYILHTLIANYFAMEILHQWT